MSIQRKPELNLQNLTVSLEEAGWVVAPGDVLVAEREEMPGVWRLHVDAGGRLRLVKTSLASMPQGMRRYRGAQEFRLYGQRTDMIEITTTIESVDALLPTLGQMMEWALAPPFETREANSYG